MLGFGKDKAVKEWESWINKRHQQQEARVKITAQKREAEQRKRQAIQQARLAATPVLEITGFPVRNTSPSETPSPEATIKKVDYEIRRAEAARSSGQGFSMNIGEVKSALEELKTSIREKEAAEEHFDRLSEEEERLEQVLEEIEDHPPKAGHGALEAFDSEIQAAEQDVSRIDRALEAMNDDGSLLQQAKEEADRAQERLDDLEATAALGETSEEEQRTAASALTKARTKVQKTKDETGRQESARRGLERKRSEVLARLEELGHLYADIAREVYLSDLESAESRLVEFLGSDDIKSLVEEINATRLKFNKAANHGEERSPANSPFAPLKVEIALGHLVQHPDRKDLNRIGIKY